MPNLNPEEEQLHSEESETIEPETDKVAEDKERIMEGVSGEDLAVGIGIEKEHDPTIAKIKAYMETNNNTFPPSKLIYEWISLDHIEEHKMYYNNEEGLPEMERRLEGIE